MQQRILFAALAVAGGLQTASASIDVAGGRGDAGVQAVESQYIAIGKPGVDCDALSAEVDLISRDNFGVLADGVGTYNIALESTCLVRFEGSEDTVELVRGLPDVADVEPNFLVYAAAAPASWGLDRIDQIPAELDNEPFDPEYDGTGATVYVLDTGINYEHVEFRGRVHHHSIIAENPLEDNQGHGSHCAGTVGGSTYGVARGAEIWGLKVLNYQGSGSVSDIADGIRKAIELQGGRPGGVLSMSLGGGFSQALNNAVQVANDAGFIVVVAGGNSNIDACGASPASAGGNGRNGGVITVGATEITQNGGKAYDTRASFSNYGSCVDIWAPGVSIKSAWKHSPTATNTISGTSMATPHVAGVAAVLLQKHDLDRDAAVAELFGTALPSVTDRNGGHDPKVARNRFLQIATYTGPPTMPTPQPTVPPTPAQPGVYIGSTRYNYAPSKFGPAIDSMPGARVHGTAHVVSDVPEMCEETNEDLSGKIAVVERGSCKFYDKVFNAQQAGAIGVIIGQTRRESLFQPGITHGRADEAEVPSCMTDLDGLNALRAAHGQVITVGAPTDEQLDGGDENPVEPPKERRRRRRREGRRRRRRRGRRVLSAEDTPEDA